MKDNSPQSEGAGTWEAQVFRRVRARLGDFFCFVVGKVSLALLLGAGSAQCFLTATSSAVGLSPRDKAEVLGFMPIFYFAGVVLAVGCLAVTIALAIALWKRSHAS